MGLMAAAAFLLPGHGVPAVIHRQVHQLVIGGMVDNLVQAPAVAVEQPELGGMVIRRLPQRLHPSAADLPAQRGQAAGDPVRRLPQERLLKRGVVGEGVAVLGRGRLVGHRMGGQPVAGGMVVHGGPPASGLT